MLQPSPQRVASRTITHPSPYASIALPSRRSATWRRRTLAALWPFLVVAMAGSTGLKMSSEPRSSDRRVERAAVGHGRSRSRPAQTPSVARRGGSPGPRRFTIAFTGDILIHERLWERARQHAEGDARFDFRPLLAPIRPVLARADLAICHLETPLSADDLDLASFPVFETPHELAPAIAWAGYEGCSTASNHSLDGGPEGVAATLRWLDRAGLGHAGTARTRRERMRIATYEVGGATLAHLSYSWGFNGFSPDESWRANRIDVPTILREAARAKRTGADLVVVSLHWGLEYTHTPTTWQREVAEQLTRSPTIDLLVGHHAHVVQPVGRVHGTWVAYGLGNVLSGMTSSLGTEAVRDGVILLARAERTGDGWTIPRLSVVTTRVEDDTWRVLPILRTLALDGLPAAMRAELQASNARTLDVLRSMGIEVDAVAARRRVRPEQPIT